MKEKVALLKKLLLTASIPTLVLIYFFQDIFPQRPVVASVQVIEQGLRIEISKTALPMAALQELHLATHDPIEDLFWQFPGEAELLQSGRSFVPPSSEEILQKPVTNRLAATPVLEPMLIEVPPPSERRRKPSSSKNPVDHQEPIDISWRLQKRVDQVGGLEELLKDSTTETPSLQMVASHLVEEELHRQKNQEQSTLSNTTLALAASAVTDSSSTSQTSVIVRPADGEEDQRQSVGVRVVSAEDSEEDAKGSFEESESLAKTSSSAQDSGVPSSTAFDEFQRALLTNVTVTGELEVAGGMAYLSGSDQILIYRESEGFFVEEGRYWAREGRYEIDLSDTAGILVAQLKSKEGQLVGEGVFDLARLKQDRVKAGKIAGIDLQLKPIFHGVMGQVVSAYSFKEHIQTVPGASVRTSVAAENIPVDEDGQFRYGGLLRQSLYQAKASAQSHWSTLVVGLAGLAQEIRLFPDSMINALLELSLPAEEVSLAEELGIIWGRVEQAGETLEGAKVELEGSELKPVYFNTLMIPDRSMRSTGANGLFAYVGVEPGVREVRAFHRRRWLPAQLAPVESEHVSHVVLEKVASHQVPVRVFDALATDQPLAAVLRIVGDENLVEIDSSGTGLLELPLDRHLLFVEASSFGDYEAIRLVKTRSEKYIHLPMISTEWLEELAEANDIEIDADRAMAVGFITGPESLSGYEVLLGTDGSGENQEVVYFDPAGEQVTEPVPGGGFIVYEMEPGLQTLVVSPNSSLPLMSQTIFAEPGVVSVIQKNF